MRSTLTKQHHHNVSLAYLLQTNISDQNSVGSPNHSSKCNHTQTHSNTHTHTSWSYQNSKDSPWILDTKFFYITNEHVAQAKSFLLDIPALFDHKGGNNGFSTPTISPTSSETDEEELEQPETDIRVFLKSIVNMPHHMWILCATNLFSWMSLVTFSLYFTDYVGQAVYGGWYALIIS